MLKTIKRILLAIACLIGALACYTRGLPQGGIAFIVLGIALEGMFWIQLAGKNKN